MFKNRPFWQKLIENAWEERNIIWLKGVRRVGKTSLCKSIPNIEYFDCESPRTRKLLEDPESFLDGHKGKRIALDEIHTLDNPSEILKLAADYYQDIKIIATGSSTLGAVKKFKDTLTGRKREIWLTPLLLSEMHIFDNENIRHRFLFGGLPSFFMQTKLPEIDFREWKDGYWAKDIQELFKVEKKFSFQKFTELLLAYSGGQFEATKFTTPAEVTRQTISNYLSILEETLIVHIIRPYSTHKATEIVKAPKVYGFDTGFVCYSKGWRDLRPEDLGVLWEQCVLNEIYGSLQNSIQSINYWRDKQGQEIDFVIYNKHDDSHTVIECKFSISKEDIDKSITKNINAFRKDYPKGKNFIVANDINQPFQRQSNDLTLNFVGIKDLISNLSNIYTIQPEATIYEFNRIDQNKSQIKLMNNPKNSTKYMYTLYNAKIGFHNTASPGYLDKFIKSLNKYYSNELIDIKKNPKELTIDIETFMSETQLKQAVDKINEITKVTNT